MSELRQRFVIGVKEENGKHLACIAHPDTGEIDYTSPPYDSLQDALNDIHIELTLRYAAKGEIIEIKTKRQLENEDNQLD